MGSDAPVLRYARVRGVRVFAGPGLFDMVKRREHEAGSRNGLLVRVRGRLFCGVAFWVVRRRG
jgi:hypothetical protein